MKRKKHLRKKTKKPRKLGRNARLRSRRTETTSEMPIGQSRKRNMRRSRRRRKQLKMPGPKH
jgi:hypothetical protein